SERSALVAQLNDRVSDLKKENHVLEDQLKKTQAKNQNLKERKKSLKIENQKLLSERTGIVGYSLKNGLRGMSTDAGKPAIIKYILENVDKWNSKILDVGFGSGVYGKLLRAFLYQNIDGVDVYEDNIKEMGLDKIYDNIHIKNILDFDFEYYDLIIMGDVLEHIELESSKKLLSRFIKNNKCGNIIVSIPYEYKQGEAYGNPYEKHLQPNANKEYMEEHYPYLQLIDTSTIPRRGGIMATYVWNKYMPHID
ncbi:MAG: class I SAM-dependent methyltransferase, partial [Euryarchaeota archaeon]|nr:class I SAM-dependent methyltransferase [Euryarchaeota archaeon]